jgi:UDP-N-acetylmuramoyl-tripeptide--D-alanyl-D-alanine ligase
MIEMSLRQVGIAVGGRVVPEAEQRLVRRVVIDSREVAEGDLFFAIRGENFDGHAFVRQALQAGAVACVCARSSRNLVGRVHPERCIWVDDTVVALGCLAGHYRRRVLPPSTTLIAITGSNGKTTTKRMVHHVLSGVLKGRASPRSFNNHIGVPLTLLSAGANDRYLVVEIGTNSRGEVASLASIVEPDVAVVTSIGEAHLEGLGGIEGVADEKSSLLDHVRVNGFAVVNTDRQELMPFLSRGAHVRVLSFGSHPLARLRIERLDSGIGHSRFRLDGRYVVELAMPGAHHASNATAAFAVGRYFGMDPAVIIERLAMFAPPDGRTTLKRLPGLTLVDDTYNANPASMAAAVETLCRQKEGRRVFVMGDMWELGAVSEEAHRRLVHLVCAAGVEVLVAVGPMTTAAVEAVGQPSSAARVFCFPDAETADEHLSELLQPGDTVLLKGSRAMKLDVIVGGLEKRLQRAASTQRKGEKASARQSGRVPKPQKSASPVPRL